MSEGQEGTISLRRTAICISAAALVFLVPTGGSFTPSVRTTAATGLLMGLLWLSEALPLGLTALVPLVVFPLTGIRTADQAAAPYANSAVFLFLGGFLVASAVEKWGLHRRIAWHTLRRVGTEPRRIVLAVMIATAGLSMWISNTATTLMLAPIAVAIVHGASGTHEDELGASHDNPLARLGSATLLAVCYGASLGGLGTPIGTPTNLIFFGSVRELFPTIPAISFAQWLIVGVVYLALALPACWLILIVGMRLGKGAPIPIERLGLTKPTTMTRGEKLTIALFTATAILWIFRADIAIGPNFHIPGWASLFPAAKSINDSTVALVMAFVGFMLPAGGGQRLIGWSEFKRAPWEILILFGGGYALADALEASGFSKWCGERLEFVGSWPPVATIVVICIVVTLLSEMASNVATASAMMPVMAAVATTIGVHPYFLMLPAVLAASSGFMLPVATAPNTIVFGTGLVKVRDMAKSGFALDLACTLIITLLTFFVIPFVLGVNLRAPLAR
ncbi:MAG: SLC13/DASS family transporter [Acidobacteria bacterium]|nr:SLC13/DASS family transporter [Acidobacteriota bacterium]